MWNKETPRPRILQSKYRTAKKKMGTNEHWSPRKQNHSISEGRRLGTAARFTIVNFV